MYKCPKCKCVGFVTEKVVNCVVKRRCILCENRWVISWEQFVNECNLTPRETDQALPGGNAGDLSELDHVQEQSQV
jgi:hypothetical protein